MKYIIVTGGLGFIGSHICVELINKGFFVIIIDNLENSSIDIYDKIKKIVGNKEDMCSLHIIDLTIQDKLNDLFDTFCSKNDIYGIIHCAGKKAVNESIHKPLLYYRDNLTMTINLLECVNKYNISTFVFSSSATVYGNANGDNILTEDSIVGSGITNPYGKTKYMQEEIIKDFAINNKNTTFILLRYFNPVGSHHSGIIGENPKDIPNNLMPYVLRVAANNNNIGWVDKVYNELTIFGNDYNTPDGTCIRDYIHVVDLAKAHISVLDFDDKYSKQVWKFNVGTGKGTSVLEIVNTFKHSNNIILNYKYGERRDGDLPVVVCDCSKINRVVGWTPTHDIIDIVKSSWKFITKS